MVRERSHQRRQERHARQEKTDGLRLPKQSNYLKIQDLYSFRMSRLVLIRVGDPNSMWSVSKMSGLWASPECHEQVVRNMFVEGYTVYALFVGTGDKLLMSAKITNVRERSDDDDTLIPETSEVGLLKTIMAFNPNETLDLHNSFNAAYQNAIDYVRYKQGSQILIPNGQSENILRLVRSLISISPTNTVYKANTTSFSPKYLLNLNIN